LLFALDIAAWQSQFIHMQDSGFFHKGISAKRFLSHSTSDLAKSNAINSASIVDLAIEVCLEDFQATATAPREKINPLVDLVSLESDIQLASEYPSSTLGYPS
jgi:hypothetical protein